MNIWTGLLLNQGHVTDEKLVRELGEERVPSPADQARLRAEQDEREARRNLGLNSAGVRLGFR